MMSLEEEVQNTCASWPERFSSPAGRVYETKLNFFLGRLSIKVITKHSFGKASTVNVQVQA